LSSIVAALAHGHPTFKAKARLPGPSEGFRISRTAGAFPVAQRGGLVRAAQAGLLQVEVDLGVADPRQVLHRLRSANATLDADPGGLDVESNSSGTASCFSAWAWSFGSGWGGHGAADYGRFHGFLLVVLECREQDLRIFGVGSVDGCAVVAEGFLREP